MCTGQRAKNYCQREDYLPRHVSVVNCYPSTPTHYKQMAPKKRFAVFSSLAVAVTPAWYITSSLVQHLISDFVLPI
jgi:hypothetical protein